MFENHRPSGDESGKNAFAIQLKKPYRSIEEETKILREDVEESVEDRHVFLKAKGKEPAEPKTEAQKWKTVIANHKRYAS